MTDYTETQELILASAKKHFLNYGFKSASLRKIVSDAGFALGAFYEQLQGKRRSLLHTARQDRSGIIFNLNCLPDHPVSRRIQQCDQCLIRILFLFIRRHPHSVLRKSRKKAQAFLVVYFWYRICPSTHIPEDKTRHSIAVFLVSPFNLSK